MRCTAQIVGSWDFHQCERQGKELRHNHSLCAQHVKQFDKWDADGQWEATGGLAQAKFWWSWR